MSARGVAGFAAGVAALGLANVILGRALAGSGRLRARETATLRRLQARRSPGRDRLAVAVSTANDVPASVVHGLAAVAILGLRTRDARVAALPAVALVTETVVYLVAGATVGRARPDVPKLDHEQPTSSFPSGHQGANVALALTYALLASRLPSAPARTAVRTMAVAWPSVLAWSRLYVGMHFASDIAAGSVNGVAAALLARQLLRP